MAKHLASIAGPRTRSAAPAQPKTDGPRFLRIRDVMRETGLPRSTIYRKIKIGVFPGPVRLSLKISAWEASRVRAWVQDRIDESAIAKTTEK